VSVKTDHLLPGMSGQH